jgi:hypothetical protein
MLLNVKSHKNKQIEDFILIKEFNKFKPICRTFALYNKKIVKIF